MYDPKTAKPWREAVAATVGMCVDGLCAGPLELTLSFYFPRPKSHYGTGKNSGLLKGSSPQHHTQKPDIDNIVKSTLDALNGVLYLDDRQVTHLQAQKGWALQPDLCGLQLVAAEPLQELEDLQ